MMESPWLLVKMYRRQEYYSNPVTRGLLENYIAGAVAYWGQYEGFINQSNP